jgi:uncharacterized paraquat-inducible protein A
MAGCYGNDPFDRYWEGQLFKYLDSLDYYKCPKCEWGGNEPDTNEEGDAICPNCKTVIE